METCESHKKVKRSFSEAWLSDERFKSWLRKVPNDNTIFRCIVCNKQFSLCLLSNIKKHAESAQHKKNIEKNTSIDNDVISKEKPKLCSRIFLPKWLDIEEFKPWLRQVQNDVNLFSCSICDITHVAGLSQIYRHAQSKIHKNNCEKNEIQTSESNKENIQIGESFLSFEEKKSEEIQYAALIADKNISHDTAKIILNFLKDIGKDPNILKSMSMGRTKCSSLISNVLCPVETDPVVQNIQNTKFTIFIDKTSDITNSMK